MPKKPKRAKKALAKKKPVTKMKENIPLHLLLLGLVLILAVAFLLDFDSLKSKDSETPMISNCVVKLPEGNVICDLKIASLPCEDFMNVIVEDGLSNTMLAVKSNVVMIGDIKVTDKLSATVVKIPDEPILDANTGCTSIFFVCNEEVYSSSCTFT